jgi:DUF971 family protein
MTEPAVSEVRVRRASAKLEVDFTDGVNFQLPAEYLRVESPSAEVQGHGPNERKLVSGKRAVGIAAVEPVGHYAVRIRFTDGHDTGIYSWALLRQLGQEHAERWQAYLDALAAAERTRDR